MKKTQPAKTEVPVAPDNGTGIPIAPEKVSSSVNDDFDTFNKETSNFKPEPEPAAPTVGIDGQELNPVSLEDKIKIGWILGFGCYLLSGFHAFIYERVSGIEITAADMSLSEIEKKAIEPYLYNEQILQWLRKIPGYWWGILHIEYMFFMKFRTVTKGREPKKKSKNKKDE